MTLNPNQPVREVTPEERKRSVRMFWLILLLFPVVVGVMVAYLSVKGRQVRDYGQAVLQEVAARPQPLQGAAPCSELSQRRAPAMVQACTVSKGPGGKLQVVLRVEGDRQYRLSR